MVNCAWYILVVSSGFGRDLADSFRGMAIVKSSTIGAQSSSRFLNSSRLTVAIDL